MWGKGAKRASGEIEPESGGKRVCLRDLSAAVRESNENMGVSIQLIERLMERNAALQEEVSDLRQRLAAEEAAGPLETEREPDRRSDDGAATRDRMSTLFSDSICQLLADFQNKPDGAFLRPAKSLVRPGNAFTVGVVNSDTCSESMR